MCIAGEVHITDKPDPLGRHINSPVLRIRCSLLDLTLCALELSSGPYIVTNMNLAYAWKHSFIRSRFKGNSISSTGLGQVLALV